MKEAKFNAVRPDDGPAGRLLAIDVGAGTQDVLLYEPGKPVENCVQMVLPSATQVVARKIRKVTSLGKALFLSGRVMGGGACTAAVKRHLEAGLEGCATPWAAKTIHNDPERVRSLGVRIVAEACNGGGRGGGGCGAVAEGGRHRRSNGRDGSRSNGWNRPGPDEAIEVRMGDLDLRSLKGLLESFETELPRSIAVAVQDHGECPGESNRRFRFKQWESFVLSGGDINRLLYEKPPDFLTRMNAVRETILDFFLGRDGGDPPGFDRSGDRAFGPRGDPASGGPGGDRTDGPGEDRASDAGGCGALGRGEDRDSCCRGGSGAPVPEPEVFLMDTGSSALWGALCDEEVRDRLGEGVTVLNIGNGHTLGALIMGERVWGIFEHHTALVTPEKLRSCVEGLQRGWLCNEDIFCDGGHGAFIHPDHPRDGFRFVAVTGPNRWVARELGYYMAVPHGNMMLAGCFGLVAAVRRHRRWGE